MKTIFKSIAVLAASLLSHTIISAQSPDNSRNYVARTDIRVSGISSVVEIDTLSIQKAVRNVNYYDGLGYPIQTVSVGAACGGLHDVVQHHEYDRYMRESKVYLPYADLSSSSGGGFRDGARAATAAFYNDPSKSGMTVESCPWSETVFENSDLGRVLEQGAPGKVWQPASERTDSCGRTLSYSYGTCSLAGQDAVRLWRVSDGGITVSGCYPPGSLSRLTLRDENWTSGRAGTTDVYTDNDGNTVLERKWSAADGIEKPLDTYYVYDRLGRLRYVLPPMLSESLARASSVADDAIGMQVFAYIYTAMTSSATVSGRNAPDANQSRFVTTDIGVQC